MPRQTILIIILLILLIAHRQRGLTAPAGNTDPAGSSV